MYKGIPYAKPIFRNQEEERAFKYHRNKLKNIKPSTGLPTSTDPIQINNGKKQYQTQIKCTEIERENRILLEKITSIMNKTKKMTSSDPWRSGRHNKSLNSTFRKKKLEEIQIQNHKLLRKLQQKKPNYEFDKMNQEWRKQQGVIKIMSHYPVSSQKNKNQRNSLAGLRERKRFSHSLQPIQSFKTKILDGIQFFLTVRLTNNSLLITGDTKEGNGIKVIEIEREEGLEFIQEECKGQLQLIFDRLRYDKKEEALYLVGRQINLEDVIGNKMEEEQMKREEEQSNPEKSVTNYKEERKMVSEQRTQKVEEQPKLREEQDTIKEQIVEEEQQQIQSETKGQNKQQKAVKEDQGREINEKIDERMKDDEPKQSVQQIKEQKQEVSQENQKQQQDTQKQQEELPKQEEQPKQQVQEQPKEGLENEKQNADLVHDQDQKQVAAEDQKPIQHEDKNEIPIKFQDNNQQPIKNESEQVNQGGKSEEQPQEQEINQENS